MSTDTRKPKPCAVCGRVMLVPRAKWERKKFCSRECLGKVNAERMNLTRRPPSEYAKPPVMYGPDNPMWREPLTLRCVRCGASFTKPHWRINNGHSGQFCSLACKSDHWREHRSGAAAPDWVGGPKTYRGRGWLTARAAVVEEQRGCCYDCGRHVGKSLPVHHVKPFREFQTVEQANARSNLVGLCQSCHMRREHPPSPRRKAVHRARPSVERSQRIPG